MFGRLNQRLKAKTSDGGAYNDLDKETENDTGSVNVTSTSQGNSFMFSGTENDNTGLGYSVEMSAAGAGVVPDGNIPNFKKISHSFIVFFFFVNPDTFTVDQAVNSTGFGSFQVKLSLITGLSWMADSMEMMILSIISPALKCAWNLPDWKQALITTVAQIISIN